MKLLRSVGLMLALMGVISVPIIIPALVAGIATDWRVLFLAAGYFVFFLGTVWRVVQFGQLADRQDDRQVRDVSGRVASIFTILELAGFHWLALYTLSQQGYSAIASLDKGLTAIAIVLVAAAIAIVLVAAAIAVSQVAIRTLGKFFDRLTIKTDHQLVSSGIYSLIRHPIYTSYILLFVGFCVMTQSLWGAGLLLATCFVWFGNRIAIEEQMLAEEFGEAYQTYCHRTKRLFPYVY